MVRSQPTISGGAISSGLDMIFLKKRTVSLIETNSRRQLRSSLFQRIPHPQRRTPTMATTSKQYKAISEDLWKNKTEKVVRRFSA
jgi:hypothetical protein